MAEAAKTPPPLVSPTRDPFLWIGIGIWAVAILPSLLPILPPDLTYTYADQFSDVPPLAVVLVAAALALRGATGKGERSLWTLLSGSIVLWLAVRGVYLVVPAESWGIGPDLTTDLLYLGGYLLLAFSLELRVFAPGRRALRPTLQNVEVAGTLFFTFGLLAYFVLIPSTFNPEVYASWVPSLLLYAVLDVYLFLRARTLLRRPLAPGWKRPLSLLAATFALWAVSDVTEGLLYLGVLPWFDPGTPADLLWHLPALTLLLAIRSRRWPPPESGSEPDWNGRDAPEHASPHGAALVTMAFVLPALHFLGVILGVQSQETELPRTYLLVGYMATFSVLLALYERGHRKRGQELQGEKEAALERLQISQRMEAVGRLASGVAHDFSNLLSVVRGRAELVLMAQNLDDDARNDAHEIVDASRRGQALVGQLLTLGRRKPSDPTTLDLVATVDELRPLLERVIPESVVIRVEHEPNEAWMRADPSQVEQVILNLAVNARDAMPGGGTLTLRTGVVDLGEREVVLRGGEVAGSYAVLTVQDTGTGVSPELRGLVFEPFFSTKDEGQGTGLGLSIVYGIATQVGGFVRVHDAPDGGAVFQVYFPSVAEAPVRHEGVAAEEAAAAPTTILLVEDDESMRRTVCRVLDRAGYVVIEAGSGGEALAIMDRREPIALLLSDLVLPDISGFRLRERALERRPDLRVLFMSGYPEGVTPLQIPKATPILEKPFAPDVLLLAVRRALESAPRPHTHEAG